jgi:hypothetical protein
MSCASRQRQAHLTLPPLSGSEAALLVAIFERATSALWRAHGDAMIDVLRNRPMREVRPQALLLSPTPPARPQLDPWLVVPMPDETEIYAHPELAALAILDAAQCASTNALKASHPELCDADKPNWTPSSILVRRAWAIIRASRRLLGALNRYREHVDASATAQEAEIPF